ncbi:hypothetical protein B0H14DRAFT_3682268 [Mycena olivaceomarginata]|nr:hypothetical protein B0H14DRAFT_3682268 [Mycena olivaceomarginata]
MAVLIFGNFGPEESLIYAILTLRVYVVFNRDWRILVLLSLSGLGSLAVGAWNPSSILSNSRKGPSGCVKLASKVRSESKENSKPVSKASASEPQAKTAKLNAKTASKPAANAKAVTTKTTAKTTKDAPAKKPLAGKSKAPKNGPSIAANAKKAVVGKKAAPAAMAKAAALKNAVPRAAPHMSAA